MAGVAERVRGAAGERTGLSASKATDRSAPDVARGRARVGLTALIVIEGLWAFSFYAVQTTLTLYMTTGPPSLGGLRAWRALLEACFGPLSPIGLASATYGAFTAAAYALPIVGGLLGDRTAGRRRTLVAGLGALAISHLAFTSPAAFAPALLGIAAGVGLLKPNLVAQLAQASQTAGVSRSAAFGGYAIAANVGALSAPLVCGVLVEQGRWSVGYASAGLAMLAALSIYVWAWGRLAPAPAVSSPAASRRVSWRLALLGALTAEVLFFGAYGQAFNVFPVWARTHVDLRIGGFKAPVTWFSTLDGVFAIGATIIAMRLWRTPALSSPARRIMVGAALGAAAFAVLAAGAGLVPTPMGPVIVFFLLVDAAIPWIDVTVLAQLTALAPRGVEGRISSLYFLSTAAAALLTGALGALYRPDAPSSFWLIHAATIGLAGSAGLAFVLTARGQATSGRRG